MGLITYLFVRPMNPVKSHQISPKGPVENLSRIHSATTVCEISYFTCELQRADRTLLVDVLFVLLSNRYLFFKHFFGAFRNAPHTLI